MGIFYREKHFTPGKKIKKNDFVPSEKYSPYASVGYLKIIILKQIVWKLKNGIEISVCQVVLELLIKTGKILFDQ